MDTLNNIAAGVFVYALACGFYVLGVVLFFCVTINTQNAYRRLRERIRLLILSEREKGRWPL